MTSHSSGYKNKFGKSFLLVMCYLTNFDDVIHVFELFQKLHLLIYARLIHDILNYSISFVLLNLESAEMKEKITKFEYLENEKSFLDETKSIFHSF